MEMEKYGRLERKILDNLSGAEERVAGIRLYLKNIRAVKHFSFGTWSSRQHVIMAVEGGGCCGFAESILSVNQPDAGLSAWEGCARQLLGLETSKALERNRKMRGIWQEQFVEMTEMALIDLIGKQKGKSGLELLGLRQGKDPYGVHVILSDCLKEVRESALWAKEAGKTAYIKVKLFGKNELDCDVIRTVRSVCGREGTYLIGDVNCGYRPRGGEGSLEEIGKNLSRLYDAGLDACEDPAYLDREEWVRLQEMSGPLALIPDYPMRPSRKSIGEICSGMGKIYNIHPDSAGSLIDAVILAERIRDLGAGLMIGDDSLVGPSATIWQQAASGLGAAWVEATEKRGESDFYYRCVRSLATDSSQNPISVHLRPGFGIELDEEALGLETDQKAEVK